MTDQADDRHDESIFTWGAPPLKFGAGASDEIGFDLAQHGARRVLILTDAGVAATGIPDRIADTVRRAGITAEVFDGVHVEPTTACTKPPSTPPPRGPGTVSWLSAAARR